LPFEIVEVVVTKTSNKFHYVGFL